MSSTRQSSELRFYRPHRFLYVFSAISASGTGEALVVFTRFRCLFSILMLSRTRRLAAGGRRIALAVPALWLRSHQIICRATRSLMDFSPSGPRPLVFVGEPRSPTPAVDHFTPLDLALMCNKETLSSPTLVCSP